MEFRIFFPILNINNEEWLSINQNNYNEYKNKLNLYLDYLHNTNSNSIENRDDTYVITNSFLGIKYRNNKKLEVKIKNSNKMQHGIEKWHKYKLGKKDILHYQNDISNLLIEYNYNDINHERLYQLLTNPKLQIRKNRKCLDISNNTFIQSITYELCYITIPENQSYYHSYNNINNEWLSIAIEGLDDISSIKSFILSNNSMELKDFILSLNQLILSDSTNLLLANKLFPVISGYPMFVYYVSLQDIVPQEVAVDLIDTWNSLINIIIT